MRTVLDVIFNGSGEPLQTITAPGEPDGKFVKLTPADSNLLSNADGLSEEAFPASGYLLQNTDGSPYILVRPIELEMVINVPAVEATNSWAYFVTSLNGSTAWTSGMGLWYPGASNPVSITLGGTASMPGGGVNLGGTFNDQGSYSSPGDHTIMMRADDTGFVYYQHDATPLGTFNFYPLFNDRQLGIALRGNMKIKRLTLRDTSEPPVDNFFWTNLLNVEEIP